MRGKQSASLRGSVEDALDKVRRMIDHGRFGAAFSTETKNEITLYVTSWVIPPLERALKKSSRKKTTN